MEVATAAVVRKMSRLDEKDGFILLSRFTGFSIHSSFARGLGLTERC